MWLSAHDMYTGIWNNYIKTATVKLVVLVCVCVCVYIYIYIHIKISPVTGLEWPRGFQEVKVPRLRDNGTG